MTTIEIPKPENESNLKTCQYCGKDNVSPKHEKMCGSNPNNPRTKKKESAMKPVDIEHAPNDTQVEPILYITDIQPCQYTEVAWYENPEGNIYKEIGSTGILHTDRNESIPCALIMAQSGILMPVWMIEGFLGMFPDDQPIQKYDADDEPFPPFPEDECKDEVAHVSEPQPIVPQKRSLLSKVFGKKPNESKVSENTKELIKEVINASG